MKTHRVLLQGDYDNFGPEPGDLSPGGRLGTRPHQHPRLRMPNLDAMADDPDYWGSDDGLGSAAGSRPRRPRRSPDIDGMMRDLGLDSPLSKRGIKGNTSPDVVLGRDNSLMQRMGAGSSSLMASSSADYSNSLESSVRVKKRSYNLTAVTEKTTVSS